MSYLQEHMTGDLQPGWSTAWVFSPLERREIEALDYYLSLKHVYPMQTHFSSMVSLWIPFLHLAQERAPWHSCSNSVRSFSSHTWQPAYMAYLACPWTVMVRNHSSPSLGEQHQTKYIKEMHFLDNRIGWPLSYSSASIWDWLQTCINYYSMRILPFKKGKWKLRFPECLNTY